MQRLIMVHSVLIYGADRFHEILGDKRIGWATHIKGISVFPPMCV